MEVITGHHTESDFIFKRIQFLNESTGFVGGTGLIKTTDGGNSWSNVNTFVSMEDFSFINNDTAWYVYSEGLTGGVFRTTNGGINWTQQLSIGSSNPDHIYMYNSRIGFVSRFNSGAPYVRKTTDGGLSWFVVINNEAFTDMYFADSLTGWKANGLMKKTTDGGISWINQPLPQGGIIISSQVLKFSNVNGDTLWGVGAVGIAGSGGRGLIYKSTNSGDLWGYQLPDTTIHIFRYYFTNFINKNNGWAYSTSSGVHTVTGGDTTFYTGIVQQVSTIPKNFTLHQNYPNPFNPRTIIPFSLKKSAYVKLTAYDINGKEVQQLVEGKYEAGEYEVDFMGKFSASGVYFYRIEIASNNISEKFTETKLMMLIK